MICVWKDSKVNIMLLGEVGGGGVGGLGRVRVIFSYWGGEVGWWRGGRAASSNKNPDL